MNLSFIFYHPDVSLDTLSSGPTRYHMGYQAWIIQAYENLKRRGFPCQLSSTFPDDGIVIGFRTGFGRNYRPTDRRFLVCVQADYTPFSFSNSDIVQNPAQAHSTRGKSRHYLPHYPQVGLTPRAVKHGDRFSKIGYFGRLYGVNASPILESNRFRQWLVDHGFTLAVANDPQHWHDYSDIDAVIAIRSFASLHKHKPATKLVNAWMARIPAILGPESAYRSLRRSELDYVEASSIQETQQALLKLRENPDLRRRIVANGMHRAKEYTFDSVTQAWMNLLDGPIKEEAQRWFSDAARRRSYFSKRRLGGAFIDYAECVTQQRGVVGALFHGLQRPFELVTRNLV